MNVLQYKTIDIKYNFIIRRKNKSDYKTLNYINSGRRIQSGFFLPLMTSPARGEPDVLVTRLP